MKEFVEKLIDRLEELRKEYYEDYNAYKIERDLGNVDGLKHAISIVNELAEEYNTGWIPCSERLPKPYKDVLVCTDAGEVDVDFYSEYIQNFIGLKGTSRTAIAWQPLPAPYISEKEEWKNKVMKHFTNVE